MLQNVNFFSFLICTKCLAFKKLAFAGFHRYRHGYMKLEKLFGRISAAVTQKFCISLPPAEYILGATITLINIFICEFVAF